MMSFLTLGALWASPTLTAGPHGLVYHLALHLRRSDNNQQERRNIDSHYRHSTLLITVMQIYSQVELFLTMYIRCFQICDFHYSVPVTKICQMETIKATVISSYILYSYIYIVCMLGF